jgi:hypothetical protein
MDPDLWDNFAARFNSNFVSTTIKEDALVKIGDLKMKGGELDEYITEHETLLGQLGWHPDSDIAAEYFRKGLPQPLAKNVIANHGLPSTTKAWAAHARTYHVRYTISKAYGYFGGGKDKPKQAYKTPHQRRHDDAVPMDVDAAQVQKWKRLEPEERERLMKEGRCFICKQTGHRSRECPSRAPSIKEVKIEENPSKEPPKGKNKEKPPAYDSLVKGINACSIQDRQKLLEELSNAGNSDEEEDF